MNEAVDFKQGSSCLVRIGICVYGLELFPKIYLLD